MRYIGVPTTFIAALLLAACTASPPYSLVTDYPGTGLGKIEVRTESASGPAVVGPDGKPPDINVPVGKVFVSLPGVAVLKIPRHFHYQIRAKDGTLHIAATESEFEVGSCVSFSGYADGPSRTHWSRGRVKVERSNECER